MRMTPEEVHAETMQRIRELEARVLRLEERNDAEDDHERERLEYAE